MTRCAQTWPVRLHYDLATCGDLLVRLGIHGLGRMFLYAEDPQYQDLYPKIRQTPGYLTWTRTPTAITLEVHSTQALVDVAEAMLGHMHQGVALLPGYEQDPSHPGYYMTAVAHTAILGFLFKNTNKSGRTKSAGKGATCNVQVPKNGTGPGIHPDDVRQYGWPTKTQNGKLKVEVSRVLASLGLNTGHITEIQACTRKGAPLTRNISPHTTVSTASKSVLFASLARALVQTLETKKLDLDADIQVASALHPLCATWNNASIRMPFRDAFAAYFSALAYVYLEYQGGILGLGLDFGSFEEADKYHRRFLGRSNRQTGTGSLYKVHGSARLAAYTLLTLIEAPLTRTYPVVHTTAKDPVAGYFTFRDVAQQDPFRQTVESALVNADDKRTLRELRGFALDDYSGESVYDRLLANLTCHCPWHAGLDKLASRNDPTQKGAKGLPFWDAQALGVVCNMLGSEQEKELMDWAAKLLWSLAQKYKEMGYTQGHYDRAREFAVTTHLTQTVGKDSLLAAVARIACKAQAGIPDSIRDLLLDAATRNPRAVKTLLILGMLSYRPKTPSEAPTGIPPATETVTA